MKRNNLFIIFAVCCLISIGCGKKYSGDEKLHPVTITVLDTEKPVENAIVILVREGGPNVNVSALTDAVGKATMLVDMEWKGAPEGTYQVRLSKEPPFTPDLSDEEVAKLDLMAKEAYDKKMLVKREKLPPVISPLLRGDESPLKITVSPGTNRATFDVAEYSK